MRLTLILHTLGCGGAERAITVLANHWASQGHAIVLRTHEAGGQVFYPLHPRVDYRPLNLAPTSRKVLSRILISARKIWRIRQALVADKPEAVITFTYPVNVVTLLATLGTGIPVVVSERVDPGRRLGMNPAWKVFRHVLYPRARALVVQTERIARHFRPRLDDSLAVIPNPVLVPPENAGPGPADVGARTVVSLGRLDAQKGFDLLVRAFALASAKHPAWDLAIFGEGKDLENLRALARDLRVDTKVRFPGKVDNPYDVLKAAGIYVSASRYEGFPNALGEALASGAAVVATDCPTGPREMITDGVDGLLVPNEDVGALAMAMDRLMGDEALRHELGEKATSITARFSIESVMARWETVLREKCGVAV
jgi:GalNAc-alpha-(1->4)-GalNAc-alpha-(1->3)-diNAcBac-PP-undecaprenol alpha-1,4-N-acetyl-D-galactosaminyltransferase